MGIEIDYKKISLSEIDRMDNLHDNFYFICDGDDKKIILVREVEDK